MAKIFISYTARDRKWANWIGVTLRDGGHVPFVHEWEIGAGGNIPRWMDERIKAADFLLAVFTDAYTQALYSSSERWAAYWNDPAGREGFLVPIEVEKVSNWPALTKPLKRLSLVGLSDEAAAETALLEFLKPPQSPTTRPAFPGGSPTIEVEPKETNPIDAAAFADRGEQLPGERPPLPGPASKLNEWRDSLHWRLRPALVCAIVGILEAIITTYTGPVFHEGQLFGFNSRPIYPYQLVIGPLCGFAFYYFSKSTILRSFRAGLFLEIVPILLREIPIDSFLMFAYPIPLVLAPLIAFETVYFRRYLLQSLLFISLSVGLTILGLPMTILGLQVSGDTNAWFQSARSAVHWFCYAYFFFRPPLDAHEKAVVYQR